MKKIAITLFTFMLCMVCGTLTPKAASRQITDTDTSNLDSLTTSQTTESSVSNNGNDNAGDSTAIGDGNNSSGDAFLNDNDLGSDLLPEVSTEGFFKRLYNKMWGAAGGVQKLVFIVLIILLVIDLLMLAGSIFAKKNIGHFLVGAIIIIVVAIADIYIVDIVAAVNSWFKN